jgi:lactate dehydrogenase-like 2-hydroxyacid dehydrogenase
VTTDRRRLVAVTRTALPGDPVSRLAAFADTRVWEGETAPPAVALAELVADADAILAINGDPLTSAVLEAAPGLRLVAIASAGFDSLDAAAAFARGIAVTNTPGVLHEATADIAFGLIVAARRRIAEADRFVRSGSWHDIRLTTLIGHDVHGARLGIVGYGEIGRAVARRATGFGMDVVHHSRQQVDDALSRWLPLDELLETSDIVSLHVPLTPDTRGLIGERELRLMKPSATLVNTARGPVVDQAAFVRALSEGWIASAGIDVQDVEPNPDPDDPLLRLPTLVVLPHIGSATEGARVGMIGLATDNVLAFLEGRPLLTPVRGSPAL